MSKIRYLSDGALRYIKSRLDSIDKKINGNEITNATKCKILNIKTNMFLTDPNDSKNVICMTKPVNHVSGNITILANDNIYNLNVFITNGDIYNNDKKIGYVILNKGDFDVVEVYINCIIDNKRINFMNAFSVSVIKDIDDYSEVFMYHIDYDKCNIQMGNNTINELCDAKVFILGKICYIINYIDNNNNIIGLQCITSPLNEYDFQLTIEVIDNKITIKSENSNYLDVKM